MGEERSGIDLGEVSQPFPLIQKSFMVKYKNICCFFECPLTLDILRNTLNRVSELDDIERGSSISLF